MMFNGADEVVYSSPAEGGAQVALATVTRRLGKQATIFVARRAKPHPRTCDWADSGGLQKSRCADASLQDWNGSGSFRGKHPIAP